MVQGSQLDSAEATLFACPPRCEYQAHCVKTYCSPLRAGPTGKVLLMPEDPNAVFIMVATGTGIAPYRAFWRRQFMEDVPNYKCDALG
jgi:hypothetical protein